MNPSTAQTPMKTRATRGHGGRTSWALVGKTHSRKLSSWESRAELPDTLEQERREKSGGYRSIACGRLARLDRAGLFVGVHAVAAQRGHNRSGKGWGEDRTRQNTHGPNKCGKLR